MNAKFIKHIFLLISIISVAAVSGRAFAEEPWMRLKDQGNEYRNQTQAAKAAQQTNGAPVAVDGIHPSASVDPVTKLEATVDLSAIRRAKADLSVLTERFEALRSTQQEQLVELRALSNQSKIHAQVLDELETRLLRSGTAAGGGSLEALDLEKYRLIRERLNLQRASLDSIQTRQAALRDSILAARFERGSNISGALSDTPAIPDTKNLNALTRLTQNLNTIQPARAPRGATTVGKPASKLPAADGK